MKDILPTATEFRLLDLTTGQSALIPLNFCQDMQGNALPWLLQSHAEHQPVTWTQDVAVFVDFSLAGNGMAYFDLRASRDLLDGRIRRNEILFYGAAAVHPRCERIAWYSIGQHYMKVLMESDNPRMASLGEMPMDHPWAAGFMHPRSSALGRQDYLLKYARSFTALVVNRLREAFVEDSTKVVVEHPIDPEDGYGSAGGLESA